MNWELTRVKQEKIWEKFSKTVENGANISALAHSLKRDKRHCTNVIKDIDINDLYVDGGIDSDTWSN